MFDKHAFARQMLEALELGATYEEQVEEAAAWAWSAFVQGSNQALCSVAEAETRRQLGRLH